jgi:hypothetical protein
MLIDGRSLVVGSRRIKFDPVEVLNDLAHVYGISLKENRIQGCKELFSAVFLERTNVLLGREQLGGIFQIFEIGGELPRALLERWYELQVEVRAPVLVETAA